MSIAQELSCSNPSCPCQKTARIENGQTHCPAHGDSNPSLSLNQKDGKPLLHCKAGCSQDAVIAALSKRGLWNSSTPRVGRRGQQKANEQRREWPAFHAETLKYASTHVRIDKPGREKVMFWEPKGVRVAGLALYRFQNALHNQESAVVVCEGESATDALANLANMELELGVVVVGTVTGASTIPGDPALSILAGRTVLLWPDNDEPGYRHMTKIAQRLHDLGAGQIGMIDWPDAPGGGDAADAITAVVDIGQLIAQALAQPWQPQRFDLDSLLNRTAATIRRYIVLNQQQLDAIALWVAHTHAFKASQVTPYLGVSSAEKGSGKSRLLEVLQRLVATPFNSSHVTASVLVRRIAKDTPTVLLDEIDALFLGNKEKAEHIRGILNAGYAMGGTYSMSEPIAGSWEPVDYDVFSPKIFAGIGNRLPDTVRDRSILIEMRRRTPNEQCERFSHRKSPPTITPIHDELDVWATGAIPLLIDAEPDLPEELSDRAADVWEPLLAIADLAGGDWPERARAAALALSAAVNIDDASLGIMVLRDIKSIFDAAGKDTMATAELVPALVAMEESPWGDLRGKSIDNRRLARELRQYGIRPRDLKIPDSDNKVQKGYRREDFVDAWDRYIPANATSATNATDAALEPKKVAAVAAVADKSGSGEEKERWKF